MKHKNFSLWVSLWVLLGALLTGCGAKEEATTAVMGAPPKAKTFAAAAASTPISATADEPAVQAVQERAIDLGGQVPSQANYRAYVHSVVVANLKQELSASFEAVNRLCASYPNGDCTVIESGLATEGYPSATLTLRVVPTRRDALMKALAELGEVVQRNTSTQDLSVPMVDTQTRVAMLKDHRQQLLALRPQAAKDIKAAIALAQELAQVQSQLEAITGELAQMQRRVNTEEVQIELRASAQVSAQPVREALQNFVATVLSSLGVVISGFAVTLPWLILLLLAWGVFKLWRRHRAT